MHIQCGNTKHTFSTDDLTDCLSKLFLVVVLIQLVLELFASATCEDRSYEVKARSRNAALRSDTELAAIGTNIRTPEQEIGSLETGVGKKHEANEDVEEVKELFAATEDAGKERDDPGTESDNGIGDGDALDSGQRTFIWNQPVRIAPLVATSWRRITEETKRRGTGDSSAALGVEEVARPLRILRENCAGK